eukprot:9454432-Alexandrium_andersonii.AAC.1
MASQAVLICLPSVAATVAAATSAANAAGCSAACTQLPEACRQERQISMRCVCGQLRACHGRGLFQ